MTKNKLLLLLALLMTAATGAWGMQIYISYPSWPTGTNVNGDGNLVLEMEASDSFENMKAKIEDKSGLNPDYMKLYFNSVEMANNETLNAKGVTSNSVLTLVYTPYSVTMKDGVKDADKWTASTDGTNFGALPIGGLKGDGSETVTLQYNGRLKVKGVKATSDAAPSVPDGAINGKFSVSDTKQVYFSKGNLQYDGTNWKFAASQWEILGANGTGANGTATNYPMDLFTWGNIDSPTYNGNTYYTENADLSGITDWGSRMGFGWYTLSSAEWTYLFNTRTVNGGTGSGKSYTLGQSVNGKSGVVIYPDDYTGEVYSGSDWATFESAGCVFLPIAGLRNVGGAGKIASVGVRGCYWSSTNNNDNHAYYVNFDTSALSPQIVSNRVYGLSVRLVCAAE